MKQVATTMAVLACSTQTSVMGAPSGPNLNTLIDSTINQAMNTVYQQAEHNAGRHL